MSNEEKLKKLKAEMEGFELPLKKTAIHCVFGKGNPDAEIVFIGEAPGKNEDLKGEPFVGAAGKFLDKCLDGIQLSHEHIYITNIVKYRPPANRPPNLEEIKAHTPFLIQQIQIIKPEVIVPLGNFATRFILSGCDVHTMAAIPGISTIHGKLKMIQLEEIKYQVMPFYHPAAALYNSSLQKDIKKDFQKLKLLISK